MSKKLKVVVFGTGFIARNHCEGWSKVPNAEVVGLYSPSGSGFDGRFARAGNLGEGGFTLDMSGVKCSRDWHDFLGAGYDVLDICTPTRTHKELALAGLEAGKHVFCEKPLTLTPEDAQELADAAARASGMSMVGHCMRFWPGWTELAPWIRQKAFGGVYSASFQRLTDVPGWSPEFRNGNSTGGAVTDLMIHDLDLAIWLFGVPNSVYALGRNVMSTDGALDDVTAMLRYQDGMHVTVSTTWARNPKLGFEAKFEVRCESATLTGGFAAPGLTVHGAEKPSLEVPYQYGQATGWEGQLHYFAECIAAGKKPTEATFSDAVIALRLVAAVKQSVLHAKPIYTFADSMIDD